MAITRARKRLFITSARQRMVFGQTAPHRVSRFVDEIPSEHIDRPYSELKSAAWFDFEDVPEEDWQGERRPAPRPGRQSAPPVRDWVKTQRKTVAPLTPKKAAAAPHFAVGDRVEHTAFHAGTIVKMTPMGGDHLVEIQFDTAGLKRLMLKAAARYMKKL